MNIYKKYYIYLCLCIIANTLLLKGQNINMPVSLAWKPVCYEQFQADTLTPYLYFEQATNDEMHPLMPYYQIHIPILHTYDTYKVHITNTVWQALTAEELKCIDTSIIDNTLNMNYTTTETMKKAYLYIKLLPFRNNGTNIEKLVSFNITADYTVGKPVKRQKTHSYATQSVLSTGNFYKIAITQTGIYKLTYNDLKALGMSMPVKTDHIALYGHGGYMLPQNTGEEIYNDLQEVSIYTIDKNNNGTFDNEDYVLFYGVGVTQWEPYAIDPICQYKHNMNIYSRQAYYFITADEGIGNKKRISSLAGTNATPTHMVNTYYYRHVYEEDNINICKVGNQWFADEFKSTTTRKYKFDIPGLTSKNVYFSFSWASTSSAPACFTTDINGSKSFNTYMASGNITNITDYKNFTPTGEHINVTITYSKPTLSSIGYLDYIEIHATCALQQGSAQVDFRNPEITGSGHVAKYSFNTLGKSTRIWDVTDRYNIKEVQCTAAGQYMEFTLTADSTREMVAFDGSSYLSVTPIGKVENQNLHGLSNIDFIIITHPDFLSAAQRLAQYRNSQNIKTAVVTTTQVYNEFSSGACDLSAIRNFLKMFYDRNEEHMVKNALLIGKTSYDPRQIEGKAPCYIPNYQGKNIFDNHNNVSTDNYIAKLADGKGANNYGTMDIGLGRWPVATTSQANALVEKSIRYGAMNDLSGNSGKISNMGNWRNIISFISDDDADYAHLFNPEAICNKLISTYYPIYNVEKVYSDAYKKEASSQGARYPEVTKMINYRVNNGCLFMTYFGHGGDNGWSHERILTLSDINSWTNTYAMPIFYTACCTFAGYDQGSSSPGERTLLSANGGGIGLITSTRNSSSGPNETLGMALFRNALKSENNTHLTIGEVYATAQSEYPYESYIYLGDPSVTPAYPQMNIVTDSINHIAYHSFTDTLKSLTYVHVQGHIEDAAHKKLTQFNGWVYPTIYDKAAIVETLNNNGKDSVYHFSLQKSIIFKGKAKAENGDFHFSFMMPKDINYEYGMGKISYYAAGSNIDANGYNNVLIGGMNDTTINDDAGPDIKLYLNDKAFVSGGTCTATPIVKAEISDESGLNTAGAGIGHDMMIIIDHDIANAITVNDYFTFNENSYTSGTLSYALSSLAAGTHTLSVRAWDIVNNMGEAEIEFEVLNDTGLVLNHVLNYPNPFTTHTDFYFEHNQPNTLLNIHISIFTISGKVVKNIHSSQCTEGFRSKAIPWDGKDDYGNTLAKGVYLYKLMVRMPNGSTTEKIEKIVIL